MAILKIYVYKLFILDEIGFAEVFVQCPVEEAINRNNQRQPRVTNDVIVTMAAKLEPPDPGQQWEKHSVKINHEDSKKKAMLVLIYLSYKFTYTKTH